MAFKGRRERKQRGLWEWIRRLHRDERWITLSSERYTLFNGPGRLTFQRLPQSQKRRYKGHTRRYINALPAMTQRRGCMGQARSLRRREGRRGSREGGEEDADGLSSVKITWSTECFLGSRRGQTAACHKVTSERHGAWVCMEWGVDFPNEQRRGPLCL